ncbi:Protein of unknown function, partial [Gryllus bimaculatus]
MPRKNKKGWGLDVVKRYFADSLQQSPYYPVLPTPFFPAGPPHPFFPFLISSHPALPVPSLSLSARSSADSAARRSAAIDTANCAVSAPRGGLKRIARGAPRAGGRRARAPAQPVSLADTEALARRPPPRPPPQAGARVTVGNHVNNVLATRGDDGAGRAPGGPAAEKARRVEVMGVVRCRCGAETPLLIPVDVAVAKFAQSCKNVWWSGCVQEAVSECGLGRRRGGVVPTADAAKYRPGGAVEASLVAAAAAAPVSVFLVRISTVPAGLCPAPLPPTPPSGLHTHAAAAYSDPPATGSFHLLIHVSI